MGRCVLIVDDNRLFRKMVKNILAREGLFDEYLEAGDGEEAIRLLQSEAVDVDLALVDLIMPRSGGVDIINWARESERYRDLPIVVLTVESRSEVKAQGFDIGASDYIVKPFDPI